MRQRRCAPLRFLSDFSLALRPLARHDVHGPSRLYGGKRWPALAPGFEGSSCFQGGLLISECRVGASCPAEPNGRRGMLEQVFFRRNCSPAGTSLLIPLESGFAHRLRDRVPVWHVRRPRAKEMRNQWTREFAGAGQRYPAGVVSHSRLTLRIAALRPQRGVWRLWRKLRNLFSGVRRLLSRRNVGRTWKSALR